MDTIMRIWLATSLTCLACSSSAVDAGEGHQVATADRSLIESVIGRATMIYSSQLEFTYLAYERTGERLSPVARQAMRLTVRGDDWLLAAANSPHSLASYGDTSIRFYESGKGTAKHYQALHVEGPLALQEAQQEEPALGVLRCGTLPYRHQVNFLRRQADNFLDRGGAEVGDLKVRLLEIEVPANDLDDAMVVVPPSIANDRQGRLRLYVCERLGYVLPRIEYLTGSGQVECTIDARQFTDAGNGLHVPKRTRVDYVDLSASPPHVVGRSEYRVVRWSRVNEPIDDEILSITVPAGTRIRDSRPDRPPVVFRLDNDQPLANLQAVTRPAIGKSTSWPSLRTICLAINLLLLFLLVVHLAVARR